jgi:DNA ligase 1
MNERQMTLGVDYSGQNPAGWFMSEKFNGCRAYWDGEKLWTRNGNIVKAPKWFTAVLPRRVHLDGEIFTDGDLEAARLATQYGKFTPDIRFVVFDYPSAQGNWLKRVNSWPGAVRGHVCEGRAHLEVFLNEIRARGGEGVVIRNPAVTGYEVGRTPNMVKVKPEFLR